MNTLPFSPPDATQIGTSCFSFASQNGRTFSFSNLEPFDCHDEDDRQALLLRLARFARHGVPHRDLMAAFGISRTRVHRALDRLQRQGEAAFHRPRRGRGTQVITGALKETANRLLASGMSGAAVARELGVSVATINHNRRRGFLGSGTRGPESEPAETTLDTEAEAGGDLLDRSARDRRDRAVTRMMPAVAQAQGTKTRPRRPLAELFHSVANSIPEPERGILRVRIWDGEHCGRCGTRRAA